MGKFDGMLLFSDMDGTLFDTKTTIPERNLKGIEYFTENGGLFAVATGRSPMSLASFVDTLGVNCPCVVLNGCGIYDYAAKKSVYAKYLDEKARKATIELAAKYAGKINTVVFLPDGSMTASDGTDTLPPCFDAVHVPGITCRPEETMDKQWFKIVFVGELSDLKELAADAEKMDLGETNTVFAGEDMFELLPGETTKGGGMVKLAEYLGYPLEKVFAIGDYYNDQEMLELGGITAAAGQAPDDLKEKATYVACHCDEGCVGWFIEKLDELF